jgi:hypothetical protein
MHIVEAEEKSQAGNCSFDVHQANYLLMTPAQKLNNGQMSAGFFLNRYSQ